MKLANRQAGYLLHCPLFALVALNKILLCEAISATADLKQRIRIEYASREEKSLIEENAERAGSSVSAFLLAVGQGCAVIEIVDYVQVRELARINGDLGRLGGLLELWLTDDV